MYDEDDELEIKTGKFDKFKKLYLFRVYREYGLAYALVILSIILGWIMVLLPATIKWGYTSTKSLIQWLSKGNASTEQFYWFIFYTSWAVVIAIWLTNKTYDFIHSRKSRKVGKIAKATK